MLVAQKEVIRLDSQLYIPSGVTLATTGYPAPKQYAKTATVTQVRLSNAAG